MTKADVSSPPLERAPQLNALATPQFLCLLAIFLLLQGSGTLVRQTLSHCLREHFERYSNSLGGSSSESELTHAPPPPPYHEEGFRYPSLHLLPLSSRDAYLFELR